MTASYRVLCLSPIDAILGIEPIYIYRSVKQVKDESLEQEMREQLLSEGLDKDDVDIIVAEMAEDGLFDV